MKKIFKLLLLFITLTFYSSLMATDYAVSGAGSTEVNGIYVENGIYNGYAQYQLGATDFYLRYNDMGMSRWEIWDNLEWQTYYYSEDGGATPPSTGWTMTFFPVLDPPPTVEVATLPEYLVKDAGSLDVNGIYIEDGTLNGKPKYRLGTTSFYIQFNAESQWEIANSSTQYYYNTTASDTPPTSGWVQGTGGSSPAPPVSEFTETLSDFVVSGAGTAATNGTYTPVSGTNDHGGLVWEHSGGTYYLQSQPSTMNWVINTSPDNVSTGVQYYKTVVSSYDITTPPATAWTENAGSSPAPTVAPPVLAQYIVSGAGFSAVNGTYTEGVTYNGKPQYLFTGTDYYLMYNDDEFEGNRWEITEYSDMKGSYMTIYYTTATGDTPPSTGWNDNGNPPTPSVILAAPTLSYNTGTFTESVSNNGTIANTLTITYTIPDPDYFTGSNGTFSTSNYTASNVPAGLSMVITKNSNLELSVALTGTATSSGSANNISNLEIAFNNNAFNDGSASAVTNATKSDVSVSYFDNEQNPVLSFDGVDNSVSCAASTDLPTVNASRTIEAYVKTTDSPGFSNILSWGTSSENQRCSVGLRSDHFAFVGYNNDLDGTISINDGVWHHVAAVFNATTMYLYVDGVLDNSGAITLNTTGQNLVLGASLVNSEFWNGEIDEIRIWNVARSQAEIQANLRNELTGTESGLLAYFKMSDGAGTSLTDNSTSEHTGTISGASWANYPHVQPTVTSTAASSITGNTATSGGSLTSTDWTYARGICWSTSETPTISDSHTTDGAGSGSFTAELTELTCETTYYVRAYATNGDSKAITYGSQVSFATETSTNGDWQLQQITQYNTTEAAIMARSGDIDNLGFGWADGFDPFSGNSTSTHTFPFYPEGDDATGTDKIFRPSSHGTVSEPCGHDGYLQYGVSPEASTLTYNLQGTTAVAATIQMFVDDFQASEWCAIYTVTIDGVDAPFFADVINSLSQTGPIGKIITVQLPSAFLPLVADGSLSVLIDDLTTGAGDGFAIDFIKLLINPTSFTYTGTINGIITDAGTSLIIENATVTAGTVSGTTNNLGYYSLSGVPAGQVYVEATKSGYHPNSTIINLISGSTETANLQLTDATITWDGSSSTDWNATSNWSSDAVPILSNNIVVPNVNNKPIINASPGSPAICNNITVQAGASVTINAGKALTVKGNLSNSGTITVNSSATSSGSLIVEGTSTGNVVFKKYVDEISKAVKWHYVSSPVAGQAINEAWMEANNIDQYEGAYQFFRRDEDKNAWIIYGSTGNPEAFNDETFVDGSGYCVTRASAGEYSFTGTVRTADVNYTATYTAGMGTGFNLVGNPFTSAISITSSASTIGNFLGTNAALLNDNYEAVYIWDEQSGYTGDRNDYKVISNGTIGNYTQISQDYIQPGQAFMVTVVSGGGNLAFNENMQAHADVSAYKASKEPWPGIELTIKNNDLFNSTAIGFNENMTEGLDPSYDVGKMKGNPNIALYTRLIEDNGVDFAIQALPLKSIPNYIISVGVDVTETGSFEFSASQQLLDNYNIVLEDRKEDVFTNLRWDSYFTTISESGIGRFYLYFKDATGMSELTSETNITFRYLEGKIKISNPDQEKGTVSLVNISGQVLVKIELSGNKHQEFLINQASGIYIFTIQTDNSFMSRKVFIK